MFIDSHCHLDAPELREHLPGVLERMRLNEVSHALCICTDLPSFPGVLKIAESRANLFASVGVHPEHVETEEPTVNRLCALAAHPKVIGIGETGLDYYWHKETGAGELEWQRERFRIHMRAARAAGLPLIVHTRNSAADTLRLMREEGVGTNAGGPGGVMHCFTEDWGIAEQALELGFYISISGIVTFKNAQIVKDVASRVPLDRLLVETDSPYLAPAPYRGKVNEPSYVPYVGREICRLRSIPVETLAKATSENFFRLFNKLRA